MNPKKPIKASNVPSLTSFTVPLNRMIEISRAKLFSKKMFSKKAWQDVNKKLKGVSNLGSSDQELSLACQDFMLIWFIDNKLSIDLNRPDEKRDKKYIYHNEIDDYYYFYEGDLEQDLLDRFSDYLLGD